ncbi:hypothetical protein BGX27_000706 [Mortierella sp. AM989]|nr:hypothetical protein BGX27_000706 [Mortierella sp. AM989]
MSKRFPRVIPSIEGPIMLSILSDYLLEQHTQTVKFPLVFDSITDLVSPLRPIPGPENCEAQYQSEPSVASIDTALVTEIAMAVDTTVLVLEEIGRTDEFGSSSHLPSHPL